MIASLAARAAASRRIERERGAFRAFLLLAIFPNLVLRGIEFSARGTATIVDVEYLAIALAAPLLGAPLTIAALVVAIVADLTTFLAPVFHFELGDIVPSLIELAATRPIVVACLALAAGLVVWGTVRLLVRAAPLDALRDWRVRSTLAGAVVLLIAVDAANGSGNALSTRRAFAPVNVAGAPILQLALSATKTMRESRLPRRPVVPVVSATSSLFHDLNDSTTLVDRTGNVGLVIVESMGQLLDRRADSALFSALIDSAVSARYIVRRGTVPFEGPTTGGEFRELCGQLRTYLTAPTTPLPDCIPARLRRLGYRTIAMHGFRRGLFDRKVWYPLIGIDSIIDAATLQASGPLPHCGTIFLGPCDAAVAPTFTRLLATPDGEHRLVYWLTLSAHFPADARAAEGSTFDCSVARDLASDESACMLARIWSRDLASVRATALSHGLPLTRFVVVGDHAPPLPGHRLSRLFAGGVVPFVELIPRPPAPDAPTPAKRPTR